MKSRLAALAALAALTLPTAVQAKGFDCPLRDAPFTIDSPLYDVLLSDAAKAAVEAVKPGSIAAIPPFFTQRQTPSFATILTYRTAARLDGKMTGDELARIDTALRALPVTAADREARCARYDAETVRFPRMAAVKGKPRVLLFEKMTGFRDGPSVEAAKAAITALAQRNGWPIAVTDKGGAITPANLRQFDVVFWNNVSGDVLTLTQRRILRNWVERGGGFVAVHGSGGDPVYFWDWYVDTLIGARFTGHPSDPQFQDATVRIEPAPSGIGSGLPTSFTLNDEWYSFAASPRGAAQVVATLDESTYKQVGRFGTNITMGADHPIAWTKCIGNGRSFYSAIGHRPEMYAEPRYVTMLEQAIGWAGGNGATRCKAGREVAASRP